LELPQLKITPSKQSFERASFDILVEKAHKIQAAPGKAAKGRKNPALRDPWRAFAVYI
jgi:hypothetical protein